MTFMTRRDDSLLDESGVRADGGVGRAIAGEGYLAPASIHLVRGHLTWDASQRAWRRHEATTGLLDRFMALEKATEERIHRFSELHGVLNLCQHGFPHRHAADQSREDCEVVGRRLMGKSRRAGWPGEPVEQWRAIAGQLRWATVVASRLYMSEAIGESEWALIRVSAPKVEKGRSAEWLALAQYANDWLTWTGVHPEVFKAGDGLVWRNGVEDLAGAVAVQLAAALCRAAPPRACKACGGWMAPISGRRGRPPRYCQACPNAKDLLGQRSMRRAEANKR